MIGLASRSSNVCVPVAETRRNRVPFSFQCGQETAPRSVSVRAFPGSSKRQTPGLELLPCGARPAKVQSSRSPSRKVNEFSASGIQ